MTAPDPFVPPAAGPGADAAAPAPDGLVDPHLLVARASLALAGAWALLLAQAMAITGAVMPMIDPEFEDVPAKEAVGVVMGLGVGAFVLAFAFVFLLGAAMLGRKGTFGWVVALVGHALLLMTCSPVLGGHGLYALLKDGPPRAP